MFPNDIELLLFCWTIYGVCPQLKAISHCFDGFFGDGCKYLSHCKTEVDENGNCVGSKCAPTWFGDKCQYKNLITEMHTLVKTTPPEWVDNIMDEDITTCTYFQHLTTITIRFTMDIKFTFLRIEGLNHSTIKVSVVLENLKGFIDDCTTKNFALAIDKNTFDIYCTTSQLISFIKLNFVHPLKDVWICSLYVSGGRNVALSQSVNFTSQCKVADFTERAVDGYKWNDNFESKCTCNDQHDIRPSMYLTFMYPVVINYIKLYYKDERNLKKDRSTSLSVYLYDENVTEIWNNSDHGSMYMNWMELNVSHPVKFVRFTESQYGTVLATLCEIETYGDCPVSRWGLDCNNNCSQTCQKGCSAMDGSCNYLNVTVPTDFSDCTNNKGTSDCNRTCPEHCRGQCNNSDCLSTTTKTINVKHKPINVVKGKPCSEHCFNKVCSPVTGICLEGCYGFNDPPNCTKPCVIGHGYNCICDDMCQRCDNNGSHCVECKEGFTLNKEQDNCTQGSIKFYERSTSSSSKDMYVFIPVLLFIMVLTLASFSILIYINEKSSEPIF